MAGERQTKRSCPFCQHDDRDMLEQNIVDGVAEPRILDKDMGWRANTAERHFQPLVKRGATAIVAINVGQEVDILRNNVQGLNGKLAQFMNESSVHDDGVISDMVRLHKEVRETLKDLTTYQEKWAEPTQTIANNTINVLKVELSKESPDTWKRIKKNLLETDDLEQDIMDLL